MAKISANNAREIDRVQTQTVQYVYTSDGRVLHKVKLATGWTGYQLIKRHVTSTLWAQFKKMVANYN